MKPRLAKDEYVLTAFAQPCRGPDWANTPMVAVIGKKGTSALRTEYIQPDDFSTALATCYTMLAAAHQTATHLAERVLMGKP